MAESRRDKTKPLILHAFHHLAPSVGKKDFHVFKIYEKLCIKIIFFIYFMMTKGENNMR